MKKIFLTIVNVFIVLIFCDAQDNPCNFQSQYDELYKQYLQKHKEALDYCQKNRHGLDLIFCEEAAAALQWYKDEHAKLRAQQEQCNEDQRQIRARQEQERQRQIEAAKIAERERAAESKRRELQAKSPILEENNKNAAKQAENIRRFNQQRAEYWRNYWEKQEQRRQAEIERKQQLVESYRQNIGQTTGSVIAGINNISQANTHFKNSDHLGGDIANANSIDNAKQDDDFMNYNMPQEEEIIQIGIYQNQPVLKVGDTIVTTYDNNMYLLSRQPISGGGFEPKLNEILPKGTFIVEKDLFENVATIGYITHSGTTTNATDCKFFEKKEQWKQIGILYNEPVLWNLGNIIKTAEATYDIDKQQKDTISFMKKMGMLSDKDNTAYQEKIEYFYIKEKNLIIGIIERSTSKIRAGYSESQGTVEVRLNTDTELLKHLNRNQYNKPAKGDLIHLKDDLYYDENKCVWKLFSKNASIYHNPKDERENIKWENLKFVRPEPSENGSFETVLTPSSDVIGMLEKGEYPHKISGEMVIKGEYQQTYNFEHCEWAKFWKYGYHWAEDVKLHTDGWVHYAEFSQPVEGYAKPTSQEYNIATNTIGYYKRLGVTMSYKEPNIITVCALNKKFDLTKQKKEEKSINHSEDGISDRIKTIRYQIMDNGVCIGWVDEFHQTIGATNVDDFKFIENSDIIGYYGQIPVYCRNDSIIVGETVYLLFLQPKQNTFNLINVVPSLNYLNVKVRYFIMYSGKIVPDYNETNFRNENLIGYVDYDYSDYKKPYTFIPRKGYRVDGVNLFGSLYIGPNNPTYPNGKLIKTLPAQDNVDAAALEHDNCYESKGAAGASDAILNSGVVDCDMELVMRCLATLQIHIEDNPTTITSIKNKLDWGKQSSIKDLKNHEQITDPIQRSKYTATFFLLASGEKGWQLILKPIIKTVDDAVTDYGEREIEKNNLLRENDKKQVITVPKTIEELKAENKDLEEKRIALLKEANQWEFMEKVYNNKALPVNEVLDAKRLNQAKQNFLKSNAELGISETETNKIINTCIIRMDEESFKRYAATQKTEMAELVGTLTEQDKFENGEAGFELGNLVKNASFEIDLANNKHKLRKLANILQDKIKSNNDLINKNAQTTSFPSLNNKK